MFIELMFIAKTLNFQLCHIKIESQGDPEIWAQKVIIIPFQLVQPIFRSSVFEIHSICFNFYYENMMGMNIQKVFCHRNPTANCVQQLQEIKTEF